jgi:tetratricopeptide (TPR) repeat protein
MTLYPALTPVHLCKNLKTLLLIVLSFSGTSLSPAQMHQHSGNSLGSVSFPVSCSPATQVKFDSAVVLLHHMTYPQAREAFQKITRADSACAMAYWGIAMTLFQPVWPTRPTPADLQRGWAAIGRAKSLNPPTERERLLIAATEAFFRDPTSPDYWRRIHGWYDGMAKAFEKFPEDQEVSAFYALALVATVPPDQISSPNNARAAEILLNILKKNPGHPGAMHYLIHANDAPGRERESLEILREYAAIAPHNPHALHMPTHIYTRLGDWGNVISGNIQAADAALEFPAGDHGQYVWDEFPHAIEYLIYAYLQTGEDDEAAAQLKRLQGTARLEPTFKTAFHLSSTRARYALERKAWAEAASLVPGEPQTVDWGHFPWPEAITWFARGLASVHLGQSGEAEKSLGRLQDLESASTKSGEVLFTRNIRVLRLGLAAWAADLEGKRDSSVALMTQASELEASTPKHAVTPAPTLPAYELLGDLLLRQGKAPEAVKAYQRSLELNPRRFNSMLGGARASRAAGDREAAAAFYHQILEVASPKSAREGLEEARAFLSK